MSQADFWSNDLGLPHLAILGDINGQGECGLIVHRRDAELLNRAPLRACSSSRDMAIPILLKLCDSVSGWYEGISDPNQECQEVLDHMKSVVNHLILASAVLHPGDAEVQKRAGKALRKAGKK